MESQSWCRFMASSPPIMGTIAKQYVSNISQLVNASHDQRGTADTDSIARYSPATMHNIQVSAFLHIKFQESIYRNCGNLLLERGYHNIYWKQLLNAWILTQLKRHFATFEDLCS